MDIHDSLIIRRSIGVDQGQLDDLIVIFDREGYSAELYRFLDGRGREGKRRRAIFISWVKYADKWVYNIPSDKDSIRERVVIRLR